MADFLPLKTSAPAFELCWQRWVSLLLLPAHAFSLGLLGLDHQWKCIHEVDGLVKMFTSSRGNVSAMMTSPFQEFPVFWEEYGQGKQKNRPNLAPIPLAAALRGGWSFC